MSSSDKKPGFFSRLLDKLTGKKPKEDDERKMRGNTDDHTGPANRGPRVMRGNTDDQGDH